MGQNEGQNAEGRSGIAKVLRTVGRGLLYAIVPGAGVRKMAANRAETKEREEALLKFGKKAKAEILAARPTRMKAKSGSAGARQIWELRLRVKPSRGQPFEGTVRHGFAHDHTPTPGDFVEIVYDPNDTSAVIVNPRRPDPVAAAAATGAPGAAAAKRRARPRQARKAAAIPGPHAVDRVEQLAKLTEQHESGALTDDEFAARKKEILGG